MKVVFFGSSDYCLPVLESLKNNFDLKLVITRPDRPVGRKQILTPSPTKTWAIKNNIPILTPSTLKKDTPDRNSTIQQFNNLTIDLAVVSDYGLIIPKTIFNLPKFGTINIHFSKLPDLRGPSPVQSTLLRGDHEAWITIFKLENPPELEIKMDSGPIYFQKSYPINPADTAQSLYTRLFQEAAKEIVTVINNIHSSKPQPQDHSQATFCKMLTREDGFVKYEDLAKPANYNKFRAYYPWPGIWTISNSRRMKVLKCHPEKNKLVLDQIQLEGEKPKQFSDKLTL